MKKSDSHEPDLDEMLPEYDFSQGIRGKYAKRFAGSDVHAVVLDSDVAAAFPTARSVNTALRRVMREKLKPRKRSRGK